MTLSQLKFRVFYAVAKWAASKVGMIPQDEKILRRLCVYRLSMSYNESYFGEPAGLLKGLVAEIDSKIPPRRIAAAKEPT